MRGARVVVAVILLLMALAAGSAGIALPSTGPAIASSGGVLLALSPVVLAAAVLVALDPRRLTTGQQYAIVLSGYGIGVVIIAVVGITAQDARNLLIYALVAAGAAGAAGAVVAGRRSWLGRRRPGWRTRRCCRRSCAGLR